MELKAELNQYTEKERIDFIVEQNHNKGYEIREENGNLEAWGYTENEIEEQKQVQRNQEIDNKIKELQIMSIPEILNDNKENIKIYQDVITGLENAKYQLG